MIGSNAVARSTEWGAAVDRERVGSDAFDTCTECHEKACQILYVRLARRIPQYGGA